MMSEHLQSINDGGNVHSDIYVRHAVFYLNPPMGEAEFNEVEFATQGGDMEYCDEGGILGVWIRFSEYVANAKHDDYVRERVVTSVIEDLKAHRAREATA